jgi:hypothetical protein
MSLSLTFVTAGQKYNAKNYAKKIQKCTKKLMAVTAATTTTATHIAITLMSMYMA